MNIQDYGLLFSPKLSWNSATKAPWFLTLEPSVKYLLANRKTHEMRHLLIQIKYHGTVMGVIHLSQVNDIIYFKIKKDQLLFSDALVNRLKSTVPPVEDHGKILMGIVNI